MSCRRTRLHVHYVWGVDSVKSVLLYLEGVIYSEGGLLSIGGGMIFRRRGCILYLESTRFIEEGVPLTYGSLLAFCTCRYQFCGGGYHFMHRRLTVCRGGVFFMLTFQFRWSRRCIYTWRIPLLRGSVLSNGEYHSVAECCDFSCTRWVWPGNKLVAI